MTGDESNCFLIEVAPARIIMADTFILCVFLNYPTFAHLKSSLNMHHKFTQKPWSSDKTPVFFIGEANQPGHTQMQLSTTN